MANPTSRGTGTEQQRGHEPGTAQQTAGGVMGAVKDTASQVASTVGSTAGQAWETTRQAAQDVASRVGPMAQEALGSARGFMRRYPIATFAIGCGLGFLLTEFLRSRRTAHVSNLTSGTRYYG